MESLLLERVTFSRVYETWQRSGYRRIIECSCLHSEISRECVAIASSNGSPSKLIISDAIERRITQSASNSVFRGLFSVTEKCLGNKRVLR